MSEFRQKFLAAANAAALESDNFKEVMSLAPSETGKAFHKNSPLIFEVIEEFIVGDYGTSVLCVINSNSYHAGIGIFPVYRDPVYSDPEEIICLEESANLLIQRKDGTFTIFENVCNRIGLIPYQHLAQDTFDIKNHRAEKTSSYSTEEEAAIHLARWFGQQMPFHRSLSINCEIKSEQPAPPTQG